MPIRYTQALHIDYSTNPKSLDPALYQLYSSAIYAKLEQDGALSVTIMAYQVLLKQFRLCRDSYKVLKEIMRPFILSSQQPAMSANTPPTFGPPECLHFYASNLSIYFELQLSSKRFFTPFEQSQIYLDGLKTNAKYRATATTLLRCLQETHIQGLPLPPTLHLNDIPGTITAEHCLSTPPLVPDSTATIHAAQAAHQSGYNRSGPPRGTPGSNRRPAHSLERKNCQCKACGSHGHEPTECNLLPRVLNCLEYRDGHPTQCKDAVRRYQARNHPQKYDQHVKKTEAIVQICLTRGMPKDTFDEYVDLALAQGYDDDDLTYPDVFDNHAHQSALINRMMTTCGPRHTPADLQEVIHPALFPLLDSVLRYQSTIQPSPSVSCLLPSTTININLLRFDPS